MTIRIGAERTGRDPSKIGIYALSMALCGNDETAMEAMKKTVAFYCASPHYHHILSSAGFGEDAKRIKRLWDQNKHDEALKLVSVDIVKALTLSGTPREIRKRIREYISAGVYPIVYPIVRHRTVRADTIYAMKSAAGQF
ncbi:MAG: LLM class flavin-dependent oxidoreductase [Nitrososphaerales archaeon]